MKLLYAASSAIEAHMILHLLQQFGLNGRIDGEYLQGGVGDLQATGTVRLMVNEADYAVAKEILDDWDASQPNISEAVRVTKKNSFGWAVAGVISGMIFMAFMYNTPVTMDGIDYDDDGRLDELWTYVDDRIYKAEVDRNRDGKVDYVTYYDWKGLAESAAVDNDFDGVFEGSDAYSSGNIVLSEFDTNGDGLNDYRIDFIHGVVVTATFYNPFNGRPLKIEKYAGAKLISAEVDTDQDGTLDTRYEYDELEEIKTIKKTDDTVLPQSPMAHRSACLACGLVTDFSKA